MITESDDSVAVMAVEHGGNKHCLRCYLCEIQSVSSIHGLTITLPAAETGYSTRLE